MTSVTGLGMAPVTIASSATSVSTPAVTLAPNATLTDTTTTMVVGNGGSGSTTTETLGLFGSAVINAGDTLKADIEGAVNPSATGSDKLTVSTTSDTTTATSTAYSIVAGHAVSTPVITPSDHTPAATSVTYTGVFTASTTGGLTGASGGKVTLTFPAGTGLNSLTGVTLTDTTTATAVGNGGSSSTTTETLSLFGNGVVHAGDTLTAVLGGVVNPGTASSSDTVTVSTTSDLAPAVSCPYYIGTGPAAPCVTAVKPTSGPAGGGSSVTITGMNFTGATVVKFGANAATNVVVHSSTSITAVSPAGTGTVDVTVTTPQGTSPNGAADRFTYVQPPTITTSSLPPGKVGTAYSATLTATGGTKPYKWSISAGSLPAGLILNPSTGVISGTPTGSGTFNFTVKVTDAEKPAASTTQALSITVT